jgi:hypothetical protein
LSNDDTVLFEKVDERWVWVILFKIDFLWLYVFSTKKVSIRKFVKHFHQFQLIFSWNLCVFYAL